MTTGYRVTERGGMQLHCLQELENVNHLNNEETSHNIQRVALHILHIQYKYNTVYLFSKNYILSCSRRPRVQFKLPVSKLCVCKILVVWVMVVLNHR